jgi:ABC-type transport system involved in multi-copper enzyme maturation permease subunit
MRRVSIRALMAFILLSAMSLAVLRNANELWAGAIFLAALNMVGIAILGASFLRGPQRAWWTGFALFTGIYLAFALVPWLSSELGMTSGIDYLRKAMFSTAALRLSDSEEAALLLLEETYKTRLAHMQRTLRNLNADPSVLVMTKELQNTQGKLAASLTAGPNPEHFQRVGHSLLALMAGLMGGMIALWFYARSERQEANRLSIPLPQSERE